MVGKKYEEEMLHYIANKKVIFSKIIIKKIYYTIYKI